MLWTKYLGRPKEQDDLIDLLRQWILVPQYDVALDPHEAVVQMEKWIREHIEKPENSRLKQAIPHLGRLTLPLDLCGAMQELDNETALTKRRFVPPTFSEFRIVFNYAMVHAVVEHLRLLTFDADETLYKTGHCLQKGDWMIGAFICLLRAGMSVAIVTAAGYPGQAHRYIERFGEILAAMKEAELPREATKRFWIMGGQCNYLLRVTDDFSLEFIPREEWQTPEMNWKAEDIVATLDKAEAVLREGIDRLRVSATIIRRERTVGVIGVGRRIPFTTLEDITLCLHEALSDSAVPCCAFNGGEDVFVDIGDKAFGVQALQAVGGVTTNQTLHFGDGFYYTGNDRRVRALAHTMWVANPDETRKLVHMILTNMHKNGLKVEVPPLPVLEFTK